MRTRGMAVCTLGALAAMAAGVACSDDTLTGPMFGDLQFSPSIENIGNDRQLELSLRNASQGSLGPILIGLDVIFRTTEPDSLCSTIAVDLSPSTLPSLASGASATVDVTIDTQNASTDCPPAQYDADLFAAVDGRVLGGATVRFNWDGTPP